MAEELNETSRPVSIPEPQAARAYDAAQVDDYIERLHRQLASLREEVHSLKTARDAAPAAVAVSSPILDGARADAAELLEQAIDRSQTLLAEAERVAAAVVSRVLARIDTLVDHWAEQPAGQVVADLREPAPRIAESWS